MTRAAGIVRGRLGFWLLVALLTALDLCAKPWAFDRVDQRGVVLPGNGYREVQVVPGVLSLVQVRNQGTIFGLFQNTAPDPWRRPLVWSRLVAIGVLLVFLRHTSRAQRIQTLALALILAGALGNLHDNLFAPQGAVRDFIQVYLDCHGGRPFHAFNIADSCICIGAVLLLLGMGRKQREKPQPSIG